MHIPGISFATEQKLWDSGLNTWEDVINNPKRIPSTRKQLIHEHAKKSITALKNKDYSFFIDSMPKNLHWRAYSHLKDNCCFLDIETTGLSKHHDDITVIGLYNSKESKIFINGKNMDDFQDEINKYPMLVTFNGKCFDIPFIHHKFPDLNLNKFHIDLRFDMAKLGYAGGLKLIEKQVGIQRDDDLQEVDGFEAVRLWYKYKAGDQQALDTLVKYNIADIENLKTLMDLTYKELENQQHHHK